MIKVTIRSFRRRLEQSFVTLVMAVLAWLLEKAVLRSIRRGGTKP